MRPWLAQVLHNARHKFWRGDTRRRRRETAASAMVQGEEVASTEAMLARLELQRMVSALVRDLDEPYRTTLLLRFFEGRTPADMARSLGIPAGTVRWRLNEGLRRVRAQLDEAHGGNRETWKAAILLPPLAAPGTSSPAAAPAARAPATAPTGGMLLRMAAIALVPALGAGLLVARSHYGSGVTGAGDPRASAAVQAERTAAALPDQPRTNRPFGATVPALIASADASMLTTAAGPAQACDPAQGCVELIRRSQLPPAVEAGLVRILAGRTPEKLKIEPRVEKGHPTYRISYEIDHVDEKLSLLNDGTFIEHQIQLDAADLPAEITATATATVAHGFITDADLHNHGDVSFYELVDGKPSGPLQHRPAKRHYALTIRAPDGDHRMKISEDGTLEEHTVREPNVE
jgi:hypothetical protein